MDAFGDLASQLIRLSDRETYLRAASELLSKLFPCDGLAWNELDMRAVRAEVFAQPADHPFGDLASRLLEARSFHPLVASGLRDALLGVWRPRRLSDVISDREFYESQLYRDGYREMQINRQMSISTVQHASGHLQSWVVNRWNHDFSDQEMELAASVQPVLRLLDAAYADSQFLPTDPLHADRFGLTDREEEILRLVARGIKTTAIGHLLGISPRTVSKHLEHAYAKLGCSNRVDAIRAFSLWSATAPSERTGLLVSAPRRESKLPELP